MARRNLSAPAAVLLLLAACSGRAPIPADSGGGTADESSGTKTFTAQDTQTYAGIAADEVVHFTGTEPFWGGQVAGGSLTYSTPEVHDGEKIAVSRFAGRNGISFSGDLDGMPFVLAIAPDKCSDGMSDRSYPFTATLQVRGEVRRGCAWTDKQPFSGPQQP